MQSDFDLLIDLLKRTKNKYSLRFLGNTELGDCWSCSFRAFWDNGNRHTLFDRSLKGLTKQVYDILQEQDAPLEMSMKDQLGAA